MTIRITRNAAGNCINFIGASLPAYYNSCLSGAVDADDNTLVNVINDVHTASNPNGEIRYEFYQIPYTEFADKDGNAFADAQEAADYITAQGNVLGVSDTGKDLNGLSVDFRLDQTQTSIIMDNGAAFGVNTIKAVPDSDGTIHIHAIGSGVPSGSEEPDDHKHFEGLDHTVVSINGSPVAGGLSDVCNALNELFTVGAFESVVISDPYSTMVADVGGVAASYTIEGSQGTDPVGADIFASTGSGNYAGLKSVATIDQAGEYFTFDIRNEGQIGFGLVLSDDAYANGKYLGSATYADPATFAVGNSAHYGFQFSHWFHPTPNGSWTNYGAATGYSIQSGWYNWDKKQDWLDGELVKVRVGINENGFIYISTQNNDGTWKMHVRTTYPVPEGFEAHLGVKVANSVPRVASAPMVHLLEPAAPTLYFRWIESPDGTYQWPLFATEEEANYYDANHTMGAAGSGTSHPHVFPDDPTATTWYMPDTGSTMTDTSDPVGVTFASQAVNWTEITSLTNSDLSPPVFSAADLTLDEGEAFNYQTQPMDTGYVTTFANLPFGIADMGAGMLFGTAPEVTGDNVANPSDSYTVDVIRTNSYGSSTGQLTIVVNNLTAPVVTPIAGVTHEGGTAMVDADTMGDGSVVSIDDVVEVGNRVVLDKEWLDNYVLPAITSGSGSKSVWIGFVAQGVTPDYSSISNADFRIAYEFNCDDNARANNNWRLKTHGQGASYANVGIGSLTSGLYDYVFINEGTHVRAGGLVASQGHDASTKVFDANDTAWNWTLYNTSDNASQDLIIATVNTTLDLSLTEFNEYNEPNPAPAILTPWNKALDFSGSAERTEMVTSNTIWNPMMMAGTNNQVAAPTAGQTVSSGHPWATACVFKADGHNSNQHIWNLGEGAGTNDDNIYLRLSSARHLYFGWGRDGDLNEFSVGYIGGNIGGWWGVYVGFNGARFGDGCTAAQLASAFDIRLMQGAGNWAVGANSALVTGSWSSVGGRMNRQYQGKLTLGGRGANRSFHGKIASFVTTTLRCGQAMPSSAEIGAMITDPVKWVDDYKAGNPYRVSSGTQDFSNFQRVTTHGNGTYIAGATQVWLMGDGSMDSYSNMIRNYIQPLDQNNTKMNMISMVSNDIQNVTIQGLS